MKEPWKELQDRGKWTRVCSVYPGYAPHISAIGLVMEKVFNTLDTRQFSETELGVYSLGRLACEDFLEIMVMAEHGLGRGGTKLIRGLYERYVTAEYTSQKTEEALRFVRYYSVDVRKASNRADSVYGKETWASIKPERKKRIEDTYEQVKDDYKADNCEKCKRPLQHGWTNLDLPSMAERIGAGELYLDMANLTNPHIHASMFGFYLRYPTDANCEFNLTNDQEGLVRDTLMAIHWLMPLILGTANRFFDLKLDESIREIGNGFHTAWTPDGCSYREQD